MASDLDSNPLHLRLTRQKHPPSWLQAIGIGLVTMIVACIPLTIIQFLYAGGLGLLVAPALWIGIVCFGLMPIISGAVSGSLVGQDVTSERLEMLRLTSLSPNDIVQAYFHGSLYRLRVLCALGIGMFEGMLLTFWS